ncbi:inositol-3-phosphate synthase, partial [Oerskovia merdavium]
MHLSAHQSTWNHGRTGIWFVGARGSVATTATLGLAAIASGLSAPTGCVTAQAPLDDVALPAFADLVVGGHDISDTPLGKKAEQLVEAGMIPYRLLEAVRPQLDAVDADIRPGYDAAHRTGSQAAAAEALAADIVDF